MKPEDDLTSIFANDAKLTINPDLDGEGFVYEVGGVMVRRVEVILTLEFAQVGVDWVIELVASAINFAQQEGIGGTENAPILIRVIATTPLLMPRMFCNLLTNSGTTDIP